MTHRPPAPPRWRVPGSDRRSPSLRTVSTLAAVTTLVLSVVTVSTLPAQKTTPPVAHSSAPSARSVTPTGEQPGNAGAAGDTSVDDHETRQHNDPAGPPRRVHKLADHPLLTGSGRGLRETECELPQWQDDPSAAEEFFTAARECLDAAWEPVLRRHHLPFNPPTLHFPTGENFSTACGTIEIGTATAAYYCKGDLYVPYAGLQTDQYGKSPGIYLALFAHEYGHHVQELSGIMTTAWNHIYRVGQDSAKGMEMSRRKELQAQCFSGMFMASHVGGDGAITQPMFSAAWADQISRGDDDAEARKHGSNAHYAEWWRTGARTNALTECNTFSAPKSAVS